MAKQNSEVIPFLVQGFSDSGLLVLKIVYHRGGGGHMFIYLKPIWLRVFFSLAFFDSTVSEDAEVEPRTVKMFALAVRCS